MALLTSSSSVPLHFSDSTTSKCCFSGFLTPIGMKHRSQNHQVINCWKRQKSVKETDDFVAISRNGKTIDVHEHLAEDKSSVHMPDCDTLRALLVHYSKEGVYMKVLAVWDELWHSSFVPDIEIVSELFDGYGRMGRFGEITRVLHQLKARGFYFLLPKAYSAAITCFGRSGQLEMMKGALKEMRLQGLVMDSKTANAFVVYYSVFGTLSEMEAAYVHVKRSGILIESEGIRAVSLAYIKNRKYYKLGEFTRDVGLGRKNSGNLLWNLLLLSYAVNFKMKSL